MRQILLLLSCLLFAANLNADQCYNECREWIPDVGCVDWEYICYPEYYTWQSPEPNWCIYEDGDRVQIQTQFIGGHLVIVAWYVYPVSDPEGLQYTRYVDGCTITHD